MYVIYLLRIKLYIFQYINKHLFSQKHEIDGWSRLNQPSIEKILLNYLISDYISCGLSSPVYYSVFNKPLQSNKSKIKFLKDVIASWECLFKNYEITSMYTDFVQEYKNGFKFLTYTCVYCTY